MLRHILIITFRNLWKHKTQTFFNIIGLAVGFACFVFWMTIIIFNTRDSFPDAKRSFTIEHAQNPYRHEVSFQLLEDLSRQFPQIEQYAFCKNSGREYLSTNNDASSPGFEAKVMPVSKNYFGFFSVELVSGSIPDNMEQGLVIDSLFAKKMFADESPLYKTIYINHESLKIFGVVNSQGLYQKADFYLVNNYSSMSGYGYLMVKLYESASIAGFTEKIEKIESVKPDGSTDNLVAGSMDISTMMIVGIVIAKFLVLLIGSLVLIIALFNYTSYTLSRFYRRTKECGIRKVNGSNTFNIFMLFFIDVFIAMIIAVILSFPLLFLMVDMFNETNEFGRLEFTKVAGNYIFYFLWSVLLAVLICLPIVGRIERMGLMSTIVSKSKSHKRLVSIGIQMAISITMVIFASWTLLQTNHLFSSIYPGLSKQEKKEILVMNPEILQVIDRELPERVIQMVMSDADVIAATRFNNNSRFIVHPTDHTQKIPVNVHQIDGRFAAFFNVRTLEGRFPQVGEPGVVTIDRKLAENLGSENLIGQTVEIQHENIYSQVFTICGICERTPLNSTDTDPSCFISCEENLPIQNVYLKINPYNIDNALANIRQQTDEYSESISAFAIKTLEEKISENWITRLGKIAGIISAIALLLSMFGVYSSVSVQVESRRREVAIRKVNGAEPWDIFVLFGKSYLIVLIIAWLLASIVTKWLTLLMSGNIDTMVRYNLGYVYFLIVLIIMILITICTIFNKVWNISKINPAEEVKSE